MLIVRRFHPQIRVRAFGTALSGGAFFVARKLTTVTCTPRRFF